MYFSIITAIQQIVVNWSYNPLHITYAKKTAIYLLAYLNL